MENTSQTLEATLKALAQLTPAQHTLLRQIGEHTEPATVTTLAEELELHPSSVRETLDSLLEAKLVTKQTLPSHGRGRPATGYMTFVPSDPNFPSNILSHIVHATLEWLEASVPDPQESARAIGRKWGTIALAQMGVPDHSVHFTRPEGFTLSNHMQKITLFLTACGFAPTPHPATLTGLLLTACPFCEGTPMTPVAAALREGMVEEILRRTAGNLAYYRVQPWEENTTYCEVLLREEPWESENPSGNSKAAQAAGITIRFFAGAAQAAGTHEVALAQTPHTLGELVSKLAATNSELARVLRVSTFLVDSEPAEETTPLASGMAVDVLPPFAGG